MIRNVSDQVDSENRGAQYRKSETLVYSLHPASGLLRSSGEHGPWSLDYTPRFVFHISSRFRRMDHNSFQVRFTETAQHLHDEVPLSMALTHLLKASIRRDGSIASRFTPCESSPKTLYD